MIFMRDSSHIEDFFVFLRHRHRIYIMENKDLNRIKVMLAEKKRTNKWLAERLGKDPATISKWVTNASQPSLENLIEISKLLEVDIKELIRVES